MSWLDCPYACNGTEQTMAMVWCRKHGQPAPVFCKICCRLTLRTKWDFEMEKWVHVGCLLCKMAQEMHDALAYISDNDDN